MHNARRDVPTKPRTRQYTVSAQLSTQTQFEYFTQNADVGTTLGFQSWVIYENAMYGIAEKQLYTADEVQYRGGKWYCHKVSKGTKIEFVFMVPEKSYAIQCPSYCADVEANPFTAGLAMTRLVTNHLSWTFKDKNRRLAVYMDDISERVQRFANEMSETDVEKHGFDMRAYFKYTD